MEVVGVREGARLVAVAVGSSVINDDGPGVLATGEEVTETGEGVLGLGLIGLPTGAGSSTGSDTVGGLPTGTVGGLPTGFGTGDSVFDSS
jgi:hypothetical protein